MAETLTRTIRVTPEQWERIEKIAKECEVSANRLVVELVMEALDRREWPRTELDIQVAKAAVHRPGPPARHHCGRTQG